jgi:hypothetical protein
MKSTTKIGIMLALITMLLTMNVMTTLIILLSHWVGHTYIFPN